MIQSGPEHWDAPAGEPPAKARPLGWLLVLPALLGLMFIPRRLGPRIDHSSAAKTMFVHALNLLIVVTAVIVALDWKAMQDLLGSVSINDLTLSEMLRLPGVLFVESLCALCTDLGNVYALLAAILATHGGCWLAAWLLMPFIAAGERCRHAYLRAAKLVLWSTICLLPLAILQLGLFYLREADIVSFAHIAYEHHVVAVTLAWLVWWVHVLLCLGARYAGPAEGPGWSPRRPLCHRCGYILTGLPLDGRCPECGLEVAESLPTARNVPAWAQARGPLRHACSFFATVWSIILRPRRFFTTLAVYQGRGAAVQFALCCCWVMGAGWALILIAPVVHMVSRTYAAEHLPAVLTIHLALIFLTPVAGSIVAAALLALLACRFGRCDPRPTTTATCYAAVFFLPVVLLVPLFLPLFWFGYHTRIFWLVSQLPGLPPGYYEALLILILWAVPIGAVVWAVYRYTRALRHVRQAAA